MKKNHPVLRYWPEVLVLFVCALLLLNDVRMKQGYHMDELLSFELANAEFNPWIVPTQPQGRLAKFVEREIEGETFAETLFNLTQTVRDVFQNRGNSKLLSYRADVYEEPVWITGQQFADYLTVGDSDAFNYLSVYFNVKDDNHPPLHFMLLHTVSSVFRGKVVPLMGCGINLLCVLGIMLLMMKTAHLALKVMGRPEWSRTAGIWAAALYGVSAAASATTLLIRMYAMVSFFCMCTLYLHLKKMVGIESFSRDNKLLILVTVLGFWTQYFFLFYCLILSAVAVVWLWRNDRAREIASYMRAMVTAGVIGLVAFPFAVSDVFKSERGVEALGNLSAGFAGYAQRLVGFGKIWGMRTGLSVLLLMALLAAIVCLHRFVRSVRNPEALLVQEAENKSLWLILVLPVAGYYLAASRMAPYLVDRYLMPVFAPGILILTLMSLILLTSLRRKRGFVILFAAVSVALSLANPLRYENSYLYREYPAQREISKRYAGLPCVCVGEGVGYYENLLEFCNYGKTLILTPEEFAGRRETASVSEAEDLILIVKDGLDAEPILERFQSEYAFSRQEVLMDAGGVYGDAIYKLSKE